MDITISFSLFIIIVLEVCQAFSGSSTTTSDNYPSSLIVFKDWCTSNGIITPLDLQVRSENGGDYRYMVYSSDQSIAGRRPEKLSGPILRIPLDACIVSDTLEGLTKELEKEKSLGKDSYFAPYINILPVLDSPSLQSMPRFWSEEKLEKVSEFDGGQIYQRVELVKSTCKEYNLDPWAYACVNSRANFLDGKGYAMTPILDMINHDGSSKTTASIIENELFLSIEKDFSFGDEVFISYGTFSNVETLCDYGFVDLENNNCMTECVDVRMIRKTPVKVTIDGNANGRIDLGSLAILRSYLASPEEVEALLCNDDTISMNTVYTRPISDANEEDVYSFIASFIDEAIYDGKAGIQWAKENHEDMIENYLNGRVKILTKGLKFIKRKFPNLLY